MKWRKRQNKGLERDGMIRKLIKLVKAIMFLFKVQIHYRACRPRPRNRNNAKKPVVIISYDDGNSTDYTVAYPLHKEAGVVAEVCVITGRIDSSGYLTKKQLQELQEAGWEIVSHSRNHNPLCDSFLIRPALAGDKAIYVEHAYRFQKNADCILGRGDKAERVRVSYSSGNCLHMEEELSLKHGKYESFRISEALLQEEVSGSKNDLLGLGLKVRNFTYPYNAFSEWSVKCIEKHYETARAERLIPILGGWLNKCIRSGLNRHFLHSFSFEDNMITERDIVNIFDKIRNKGVVCIFYAHSSSKSFNIDLLKFIFKKAKERNITFATRSMLL